MSEIIISIENLSKKYLIFHQANRQAYKTFRGAATDALRNLAHRLPRLGRNGNGDGSRPSSEEFWALRDVSLQIERGGVLGVIGRNGAGKSTLLKILSRITEPTEGRVRLKGRVASLLEVGTGFHPELTGRENIYLNGAILGMRTAEIKRKFDEIVAFSGVEKFLDTPVKRYSSGMYVRMAFSVAAHLEPEILIVDEVLAVGDAEFQRKCLGKMQDVSSRQGRTVIFVSHNLAAVKALCQFGVLLQNGEVLYTGSAQGAIERYISSAAHSSGRWNRNPNEGEDKEIRFDSVCLLDGSGNIRSEFDSEDTIVVNISATALRQFENVQFVMRVTNQEGIAVFTTCNTDEAKQFVSIKPGAINYTIRLTPGLLTAGRYALQINAHVPKVRSYDLIDNEISFLINETSVYAGIPNDRAGVVNVALSWQS